VDIHKPKPWHGWREFLKEYATIVLGVLTAIGAEQAVESLHWHERMQTAQENLREDLRQASAPAQSTVLLTACGDAMLDGLARALLKPGDDWRPPFVIHAGSRSVVFVAPTYMLSTESWRNAQADGTANHFPGHTQALYATVYDRLAQLQAANNAAQAEIAELDSLAAPRPIDPQSRNNYLRLVYRVRAYVDMAAIRGDQFLTAAKALGVPAPDPTGDFILKAYQQACARFQAGEAEATLN